VMEDVVMEEKLAGEEVKENVMEDDGEEIKRIMRKFVGQM